MLTDQDVLQRESQIKTHGLLRAFEDGIDATSLAEKQSASRQTPDDVFRHIRNVSAISLFSMSVVTTSLYSSQFVDIHVRRLFTVGSWL